MTAYLSVKYKSIHWRKDILKTRRNWKISGFMKMSLSKGVLHIEGERITELYVDSFFENQGIGGRLIQFAIKQKKCSYLWVFEKNTSAVRFYERYGFAVTGAKKLEEGTTEYIVEMRCRSAAGGSAVPEIT